MERTWSRSRTRYVPFDERSRTTASRMTVTGCRDDEALVPYWDPRYHQFFFSGLMPPPSGDPRLQAVYAESSIEVYPDEPYKENSILVTPEKRMHGDHDRRRRRVSWSAFLPHRYENKGFWRTIPFLVCMAILLLIFFLMVTYWLWGYMDRSDVPQTAEPEDSDEHFDVRIAVRPFFPRANVLTETFTVPRVNKTRDSLRKAKQKRLNPTGDESIDAFENNQQICGSEQDRARLGPTGSRLNIPASYCCDVELFCLYTVSRKLVSHATPDANSSCSLNGFRRLRTACSDGRQPKPLLGVKVGGTGLRNGTNDSSEGATRFLLDAVSAAKRGGLQGIALWWGHDWKHGDETILNACLEAAEVLRPRNLSFTFLFPYPVNRRQSYSRSLARLEESLHASSNSIVFYPHISMFGRKTAWPAPRDVVLEPRDGVRHWGPSICYLFTTTPFLARLNGKCDPGKVQETAGPLSPASIASDDTCRSLWSKSAMVASHRYYTLRCRGSSGILYQTAAQMASFRRAVLSLAGTSCHGTVDGWRQEWQPVCLNLSATSRNGRARHTADSPASLFTR
ncbi:hypothetical protein V5799_017673 [Amblyomma americanum]|uniref:Uncharacterized protein n=1 Tax=Amblyomma americanum TaxID=6943 RepID=A0AAQ4F2J9_AMBAM